MIFIGVDPGLDGAIAFLRLRDYALRVYDMPTELKSNGKRQLDLDKLCALLLKYLGRSIVDGNRQHALRRDAVAIVENVGEGVFVGGGRKASALTWFVFGKATGSILGALTAFGIRTVQIRPAVWKAVLGVTADKATSRAMAQKLFPGCATRFKRVKDDGRAEAALIAYVGASKFKFQEKT